MLFNLQKRETRINTGFAGRLRVASDAVKRYSMFCTCPPKSGCRPHGCWLCRIPMADWYTPGYTEIGRWDAVARMRHIGVVEGGIGRVISCESCVALKYRSFDSCEPGAPSAAAASPGCCAGFVQRGELL